MEVGSGNVFADLGFPDAVELKTKVRLAVAINRKIAARGCSQVETAELLSIDQPELSALLRYRIEEFSVECLMNILDQV